MKTIDEQLEANILAQGRNNAFLEISEIIQETLEERGDFDTFMAKWRMLIHRQN